MKNYILALDEGTTSARALLIDRKGKIVSMAQKEFLQIYPAVGYVEQNPMEIYAAQYATMTEAIVKSGIRPEEIAAIGITNQRETTVVWDKKTGKPIMNAIVWQCRRTAPICEQMIKDGLTGVIREKTGLRPDAYFSASKLMWILENVEGARERAEAGELLFGTVDTWLIWKLSDGRLHVTDHTNASRTMLYNIHTLEWDNDLLKTFNIPRSMLPEVRPSSAVYGDVPVLGVSIPIAGVAGDQQAALYGQCCFEAGETKNTYGTGCFLLTNTGTVPCKSESGLLTTMAASRAGEPVRYALEGSVFVGGAIIQWLRDEMGLISEARDSEYFATKIPDNGGVYLVPAFAGLGAPTWDMYARGTLIGLTRGTGRNHVIRAALESIAYQTDDLLRAIRADAGIPLPTLRVDGGASANKMLMQFQADVSDTTVVRASSSEATALGAAYLAGLAVGFFRDEAELRAMNETGKTEYVPKMEACEREKLLSGWHKAVGRACDWAEEETK